MSKNQIKYELIGFYENYNNSGRIKLKLTNSDSLICHLSLVNEDFLQERFLERWFQIFV